MCDMFRGVVAGDTSYPVLGWYDVEQAIKAGIAKSWEFERTIANAAGSQNYRINNPYADGILVVGRVTITVEGTGTITTEARTIVFEANDPEVGGTAPGRRSAAEEPTKESLVIAVDAAVGDFRSTNWSYPGLPLRRGRHLGIVQGGPAGTTPTFRLTAHGWHVPGPRRS